MRVELLYHTPNPERAIATAARLCYAPIGASELMEDMPTKRMYSVLSTVLTGGHFSTLEHASFTFALEGVSRTLTHQLVRHRLASYEQQSPRYVKYKDGIEVIKPPTNAANEEAVYAFLNGKIAFLEIEAFVKAALEAIPVDPHPSLRQIMAADSYARMFVKKKIERRTA